MDLPIFPTLKQLDLSLCFHYDNIDDLVNLLQHSPALETLKFVHKCHGEALIWLPPNSLPVPPVTAKKHRSNPTRRRRVAVDWLSQLPNVLLVTILSLLPIKYAARTSVLSRCFRDIWTTCPSIEIAHAKFPNGRRFTEATHKCLLQHDTYFKLLRFSINPGHTDWIVLIS